MEAMGDFVLPYPSDDQWEPLSNMFFCHDNDEELDNLAQRVVLDQYPSVHDQVLLDSNPEGSADQMPGAELGSEFYVPVATPSMHNDGGSYDCYFGQMHMPMGDNDFFVPDFSGGIDLVNDGLLRIDEMQKLEEEVPLGHPPPDHHESVSHFAAAKKSQPRKRKSAAAKSSRSNTVDDEGNADVSVAENPKKKKPCVSRNMNSSKKKTQPRRKQKKIGSDNGNNEEAGREGQISSSNMCSSEEDNNSDGKAREPSRGTATDPQSLYARKRREKINERLRILQNLVPNGTKVDISTMLEEAVHYVKFLQLQIKLLSSDNMWMYAPIAYNGMDIGLSQILHLQPQPQP